MRHWVYVMKSKEPDPINRGDMKSWFFFYRWGKKEEVWLPVEEGDLRNEQPSPGDLLWLVMDNRVLGNALVLRLMENYATGWTEIWYDAATFKELDAWITTAAMGLYEPLRRLHDPADQVRWLRLLAQEV